MEHIREISGTYPAVFNKALTLNFPLTIWTTTPFGTWSSDKVTMYKKSLELEKANPMKPAESNFLGVSAKFAKF